MADDETASDGAPRRKREAPTIDLTAKDVTPQAPEPQPAAAEAASETPPPEEPAPAETTPEPSAPVSLPEWSRSLGAGAAGGVIAAAVFGALWYGGALPPGKESTDAGAQIAALQQQVDALRNRPAPQTDTRPLDTVTQRVGRIEDALKLVPGGDTNVAERVTAAENAMKSLGVALTALNQRSDDASANAARAREQADAAEKAVTQLRGSVQDVARDASSAVTPAQIDALTQRLATLEQATKTAHADIDKTLASEKATRLSLAASALRTAVITGAPFASELTQAKSLGAPERYLAPLSPFAASGVPSAAALAQELRGQLPQMVKLAGAQAPAGGFLERLQANASKLVKITPVDAPPGDDVSAVLARLEIAAAHADIAGALTDLGKLPDAVRAPAQGFIDKAKAREMALTAARDLAADTMRALGSR
ncbi:hypothetical protein MXD81_56005 [Microbacteriaceae bacterium K1510]|nr:hypothetical protein [Microbacteriaceae bacterium K1510]